MYYGGLSLVALSNLSERPPGEVCYVTDRTKVVALTSGPCADGQRPETGAEEQLDNRPDPCAREAYAFFQHGAAGLEGGTVDGWGG